MRKVVIIGCFIAGFLLLIAPSVSTVGYDVIESGIEEKIEGTSVIVSVRGGLGVHININGVTEETVISTMVKGFLISDPPYSNFYKPNRMSIVIETHTLLPCIFLLYISVYNEIFSYEGHAFLSFVWGIKPVNI